MIFCNKDLINIFGFSRATFYRRLHELKQQKKFNKKTAGIFYNVNEAQQLAQLLNLEPNFNAYLKKNNRA